jgi:hypothetical protein
MSYLESEFSHKRVLSKTSSLKSEFSQKQKANYLESELVTSKVSSLQKDFS